MSSVSRRPQRLVFAAAFLSGLIAGPGWAAEAPAPGQVIGYAKADRGGASQAWDLPPDKPYLYVPILPAALGGRIATVETGPEVGVALFQGPYFTARDRGCQAALGTARQPRMAWLGATARFAPAPPGQLDEEPPALPQGVATPEGYGSMILYRTDLGPPPGALLLDRRATVGLRCANPAYKTVYNRIFVPVAEAPRAERCFDLVGNYRGAPGVSEAFQLDFVGSDRVALLMPGDMAERYAPIRHDITVTLFDGLSCRGRAVALNSRAQIGRDIRLSELDFRDRARSLRLSYDYGNADAFLDREAVPPAAPAAAAPGAPPKAASVAAGRSRARAAEALAAQPIVDPAIAGTAPAPMEAAPKELARVPAEVRAPPPAPSAEQAPTAAPAKAPAEAPAAPPIQAPAKAAEVAVGEPVPDRAAKRNLATTPPTARAIPKLSPVLRPPESQVAALPGGPQTFPFPVHELFRLNHCLYWQRDCGQAAATAWCQTKGYGQALEWSVDENIGAIFPTVVLGEQRVCAQFVCDGFKEITCGP